MLLYKNLSLELIDVFGLKSGEHDHGDGSGHSVKSDIQSWTFGVTIKRTVTDIQKHCAQASFCTRHPRCIQHDNIDHHQRERKRQTSKQTDVQTDKT